jgi:hypothetical protein
MAVITSWYYLHPFEVGTHYSLFANGETEQLICGEGGMETQPIWLQNLLLAKALVLVSVATFEGLIIWHLKKRFRGLGVLSANI